MPIAVVVPARRKTLTDLVRDKAFWRRHEEFLLSAPLEIPRLRSLQERYREETSDLERRRLALLFEPAVCDPAERAQEATSAEEELEQILTMPPMPYEPPRGRAATERFARAVRARDLYRDGLPLQAIAEQVGVSPATVARYLAELSRAQKP